MGGKDVPALKRKKMELNLAILCTYGIQYIIKGVVYIVCNLCCHSYGYATQLYICRHQTDQHQYQYFMTFNILAEVRTHFILWFVRMWPT